MPQCSTSEHHTIYTSSICSGCLLTFILCFINCKNIGTQDLEPDCILGVSNQQEISLYNNELEQIAKLAKMYHWEPQVRYSSASPFRSPFYTFLTWKQRWDDDPSVKKREGGQYLRTEFKGISRIYCFSDYYFKLLKKLCDSLLPPKSRPNKVREQENSLFWGRSLNRNGANSSLNVVKFQ